MMKKVLLDYDNTICNLSKGMFEKWNSLNKFDNVCHVELSDIVDYRLTVCFNKLGVDFDKSIKTLNEFWKIKDIYQDHYYDMYCRNKIVKLLKELRNDDYSIELNTLCPSVEFIHSKIRKIGTDIELLENIDDLYISLFDGKADTCKSFDYDIVIEDNPIYIEEYLKHNEDGIVYMPIWKYNEYLKDNNRIRLLEMEK
jgi:hypothetical protein